MKKKYKQVMEKIEAILAKDVPSKQKTGLLTPSSKQAPKNDDVMSQVAKYIKAIRNNKKGFIK